MLTQFTIGFRWWDGLWGGGHTPASDPTLHDWRAALPHKDSKVLIIGRRAVRGCASVMQLSDDLLDVSVYDATPEEIAACVREGRPVPCADITFQTRDYPGWGLEVLDRLCQI